MVFLLRWCEMAFVKEGHLYFLFHLPKYSTSNKSDAFNKCYLLNQHQHIAKIVSFQLGPGFWGRMWLLSCGIRQAWWISLRIYGSSVCCGLGFGTFRLFCLWASATDLKTVSRRELSRKESCCSRRVFFGPPALALESSILIFPVIPSLFFSIHAASNVVPMLSRAV